jgi:hypothetical protein
MERPTLQLPNFVSGSASTTDNSLTRSLRRLSIGSRKQGSSSGIPPRPSRPSFTLSGSFKNGFKQVPGTEDDQDLHLALRVQSQ